MMSNTVKNSIGREVLTEIQGIGSLCPFRRGLRQTGRIL